MRVPLLEANNLSPKLRPISVDAAEAQHEVIVRRAGPLVAVASDPLR